MANSFKVTGEYKLGRIPFDSTNANDFFTIIETENEKLKSQNSILMLNVDNADDGNLLSGLSIQRGTGNDATLHWDEAKSAWVFVGDNTKDVTMTTIDSNLRLSATGNNIYIQNLRYPNDDGEAGQYLRTNGSGEFDFAEIDLENETAGNYAKSIQVSSNLPEQSTSGLTLTPAPSHATDYIIGVDSTVVRTEGKQTISGEKTFSNKSFFSDDVTINADFYVEGTITSIEKEDLLIRDNRIVLNSDTLTGDALGINSGIEIMRGDEPGVELKWVESEKIWVLAGGKRDKEDYEYHKILTIDDYGKGNGIDADKLDGQHGEFYQNASNLATGTLPPARFTDNSHGARAGGSLHSNATVSVAGFMSGADKTKLNNIEENANEYIHPKFDGDVINLSTGTLSGATIINSLNINLTTNDEGHVVTANALFATREMTFSDVGALGAMETAVDSALLGGEDGAFYQNASNLETGTLPSSRFTDTSHGTRGGGTLHTEATPSSAGFLSSSDKSKLDTISEGATVNQNIIAGMGLSGGGSGDDVTIDIIGIDGISVSEDDIGLDFTNTRNTDHEGISIVAGDGLTGGGNITASRTLTVGQGTGITISENEVSHADTSSQVSVDNNNGTVIQDVSVDDFGHITSLGSANLDSRFIRHYSAGNTDITEIGRYLYFHTTDSNDEYDILFDCDNANNLTVVGGTLSVPSGIVGNASSANKWKTGRKISLSGGVTGSITIDGSKDMNMTTTVTGNDHSHTIENITGLQEELDGKLGKNENAVSATKLATARAINGTVFDGTTAITTAIWGTERTVSIGGTAKTVDGSDDVSWAESEIASNTATKWKTARTITLGGDLTGSVSIDGSVGVTLNGSVKDNSHGHTIANVTDLQDELDGKALKVHGHAIDDINELQGALDNKLDIDANAVSATKWETARTITLEGGVTGSFVLDGTENLTVTTSVTDGSHEHEIDNINGLQGALDNKLEIDANAVSATKLETSRTINGTAFDGTTAITTANWGAGRDITIGETSKTVNGSGDVAWTLGEMGAAPTVHTHAYAPLTGEGVSGVWDIGIEGNASTSDKWKTERTLTLTGDVLGSISFDGSENITLNATVSGLNKSNYPPIYEVIDQDFSGVVLKGYLIDTSVTGITFTLPPSPEIGDWILLGDYDGSCSAEKSITITSDDPIHGINDDLILTNPNIMVSLSFVDTTQGWRITDGIGETVVHPEYENQEIIAGKGLVGGGSDDTVILDVIGGDGIISNDDDIALDNTHVRNVDHSAVEVIAGSGLNGGGDITSSRTLNIGQGDGIIVSSTSVSHGQTSEQQSVDNSNGVVIQDVTLDEFGHITNLGTVDLDNRFIRHYDVGNTDNTEIGQNLDFHTVDSISDFDVRLSCTTANNLSVIGGTLTVPDGITGISSSANKWETERTITLGGDLTGSVSLDGTTNVTLTATVSDDSHTHTIANVTGLQDELDGKAPTSHTHTIANVTGLQPALDGLQDDVDGKAPTSHTHTIANVTGLQDELDTINVGLDEKADTVHTHTTTQVTGLDTALDGKLGTTETALSATKWETARTITFSGDVTGSFVLDGTENLTVTTSVTGGGGGDIEIGDVIGLTDALDNKLDIDANAVSATKWETARTITLTGAISGSTSIDGSGNVSLETIIAQGNYPPAYSVVAEDTAGIVGSGYLVNTNTGTVIFTLPATATTGDWISIGDYDGSCSKDNAIIITSTEPIHGTTDDLILSNPNVMTTFSYIDATQGWRITDGIGETATGGAGQNNYPPAYSVVVENATAEAKKGYLVDTSEASRTITLPATPNEGDWISIGDYDGSCSEETPIIITSANPIHGTTDDLSLTSKNVMIILSYIDDVQGWKVTDGIGETDGKNSSTSSSPEQVKNSQTNGITKLWSGESYQDEIVLSEDISSFDLITVVSTITIPATVNDSISMPPIEFFNNDTVATWKTRKDSEILLLISKVENGTAMQISKENKYFDGFISSIYGVKY